jgi:hypothetical protein
MEYLRWWKLFAVKSVAYPNMQKYHHPDKLNKPFSLIPKDLGKKKIYAKPICLLLNTCPVYV